MRNRRKIVCITRLEDQVAEADLKGTTASERLAITSQLTVDAWRFKRENFVQSRLQRHIMHILR